MLSRRGTGFGFRGGMGFGFRGSSPPWPYVGLGRGGLPRCGYFLSGAAGIPAAWPYQQTSYPAGQGFGAWPAPQSFYAGAPSAPQMTREQELDFLKNQTQAMRGQLEQIEARIQELGSEKE